MKGEWAFPGLCVMKVGFGHEKGVTIHRRGKASVLDMGTGHCLEPEGNGVSLGEGGEGGSCPQEVKEISSQCSVRARTT